MIFEGWRKTIAINLNHIVFEKIAQRYFHSVDAEQKSWGAHEVAIAAKK